MTTTFGWMTTLGLAKPVGLSFSPEVEEGLVDCGLCSCCDLLLQLLESLFQVARGRGYSGGLVKDPVLKQGHASLACDRGRLAKVLGTHAPQRQEGAKKPTTIAVRAAFCAERINLPPPARIEGGDNRNRWACVSSR